MSDLRKKVRGIEAKIHELHRRYDVDQSRYSGFGSSFFSDNSNEHISTIISVFSKNSINNFEQEDVGEVLSWRNYKVGEKGSDLLTNVVHIPEHLAQLEEIVTDKAFRKKVAKQGLTHEVKEKYLSVVRNLNIVLDNSTEQLQKLLVATCATDEYIRKQILNENPKRSVSYVSDIKKNQDLIERLQSMAIDGQSLWERNTSLYFEASSFRKNIVHPSRHGNKIFQVFEDRLVIPINVIRPCFKEEYNADLVNAEDIMRKESELYLDTIDMNLEALLRAEHIPGSRNKVNELATSIRPNIPRASSIWNGVKRNATSLAVASSLLVTLFSFNTYVHSLNFIDNDDENNVMYLEDTSLCESAIVAKLDNTLPQPPFTVRLQESNEFVLPGIALDELEQVDVKGYVNDMQRSRLIPMVFASEYEKALGAYKEVTKAYYSDSADIPASDVFEAYQDLMNIQAIAYDHSIYKNIRNMWRSPTDSKQDNEEQSHYPIDPIRKSIAEAMIVEKSLLEGISWITQERVNDLIKDVFLSTNRYNLGAHISEAYNRTSFNDEAINGHIFSNKSRLLKTYLTCKGSYDEEGFRNLLDQKYTQSNERQVSNFAFYAPKEERLVFATSPHSPTLSKILRNNNLVIDSLDAKENSLVNTQDLDMPLVQQVRDHITN